MNEITSGPSISLMAKLFKTAGVESRAELEEVVKGHFRNAQVLEYSYDQLVLTLLLICIFLI